MVGVAKDTHLRSAQPITKFAKRYKIKGHFKQYCKTKNPGGTYQPRGSRRNNLRYPGGLSNHLVTIQGLIMSFVKTQYTLHSTKDPKLLNQIIFYLMKYQILKY